uniref:GAG-pre-integrase domain-containing protein n=1 Tax=Tanacetum cinerariifolium TaxID=118510 RepID=A0A699HGJ0_TANCI|nr:hypothetical protein [Tanacetum cinerariifolium]
MLVIRMGMKEEAGIQLQVEEFDLMAAATDLDEIEEVNANCILMANLQQASTSGTQTDKAPVYDSDRSAEVHDYENCNDNEIFNMFTQEEQYTELLEPIPELQQVPQNDNNVISEVTSVEQCGEIVEQHSVNFEETRALYDSLYQKLAIEVEKVNSVNRKLKETNADLTTELARFKNKKSVLKLVKKNMTNLKDVINHYKDMQQKIKRLQAQLGDLKGKSKDTSCVSDTLNPLSQKIKNENVELEFQALNYARENAHLKATYKNLFDFISVSHTQTKTIIASLQNELQNTIYENAKLRAHLFNKVSDQKDNKHGTSKNTKFAKQLILEKPPMLDEIHALSKPVTSNSDPTPQESKVVKNDKVIAPGMVTINPFKTSREEKHVSNNVRASARTKPITVSQPSKNEVNSDSNGFFFTGIDNTKTRRPHPRSNKKNDRVSSASKSSRSKYKEAEVEEHHWNLLLSKNKKRMSSACNSVKLASQNVKSKVVCAMCKQCLISVNHDVYLLNYVNGKTSRGKKQKANVSMNESQRNNSQRWLPTGRLFDLKGKIIASSDSEGQSDCSNGDNACTPNPLEPTIKRFPKSTFSLAGFGDLLWGNILITRVYFVKGLGHNLFSEIVSTNLYTINLHEMASESPICLMARASSTKSWLWHQCLSHLNFDTINDLSRNDLVSGLPKFKYHKEHLFPSCEQGKSKRASHPPKPVPNSRQRLHLHHMDLCGPMRIASINGKRYVLVTVDDYSRYTWVHFLRSKDEAWCGVFANSNIIP